MKKHVIVTSSDQTGHNSWLRPIKNFGFGPENNQLKPVTYYGRKLFFNTLGGLRQFLG